MAIKVVLHIISSPNGGTYTHLARFYNPARSRRECVQVEVGGISNARAMAHRIAGNDYEAILAFESDVKPREMKSILSNSPHRLEHETDTTAALCAMFDVPASVFDKR